MTNDGLKPETFMGMRLVMSKLLPEGFIALEDSTGQLFIMNTKTGKYFVIPPPPTSMVLKT